MHILEKQIGYTFNNQDLLIKALTHRSAGKKNNQRLEYLGDAVLDCIIADKLYTDFPNIQEGLLSQYRALLVNQQSLVGVANRLKLLPHIILGPGEKLQGKVADSILADTVEAIIAAIYLDTDFSTCKTKILVWFADQLIELKKSPIAGKDSKSLLQEWCQAQRINMPVYSIVKVTGQDHNQLFYAECSLLDKTTCGEGRSHRQAEQNAAEGMLKFLKVVYK